MRSISRLYPFMIIILCLSRGTPFSCRVHRVQFGPLKKKRCPWSRQTETLLTSLPNNSNHRHDLAVVHTDTAVLPASQPSSSPLDRLFSTLTLGFPGYVLLAAFIGICRPTMLAWVNQGSTISILLASVMCGTGLTLQADDFRRISPGLVVLGVLCQFGIMPFSAWLVARTWLQNDPDLFLGLCLVGCCPGGTASNLVSLIANADTALSVVLTACSTLLAVIVTPAFIQLLVRSKISSTIHISGLSLVQATAKVILAPVLLGMVFKTRAPQSAESLSRLTPLCSAIVVALICGGVVAQNTLEWACSCSLPDAFSFVPKVLQSVISLHTLGFALGYLVPLYGCRWWHSHISSRTARTISIEVGMQNSALAVVLARSITSQTSVALPGALSATVHSCLGSLFAAVCRIQDEYSTQRVCQNHRVPHHDERIEAGLDVTPSSTSDEIIPESLT